MMEPLEIMPIRTRITSILRKALLAGEYKNGQELSLTEISAELGVSRTPVREAFQTLAAEGLIELRLNKGAIVKQIDRKFIIDHYEMRILLECDAVVRATNRNMDVSHLLTLLQNTSTFQSRDYIELNQKIHFSIWAAADNQKLSAFLMSLWNGPSTGKANSEREHHLQSTAEHIQMLEYISKGDAEQARIVMQQHISRSMENILNSFQFPES